MSTQRLERIDFLAEFLRDPVREFLRMVEKDLQQTLFVVYTWRSVQHQYKLYQQGRQYNREEGIWVVVDDQAVVTDAVPGSSPHNVVTLNGSPASVAVDVVPMHVSTGALLWNTPIAMWQRIYAIAWRCGLDPLGDSVGAFYKRDLCHFEEPAWAGKLAGLKLIQPHADLTRTV